MYLMNFGKLINNGIHNIDFFSQQGLGQGHLSVLSWEVLPQFPLTIQKLAN